MMPDVGPDLRAFADLRVFALGCVQGHVGEEVPRRRRVGGAVPV
jgi:hypothetical protein